MTIPNDTLIFITDVGTTSPYQLVCSSDRVLAWNGQWYFPDGSHVPHISDQPSPTTFYSNRSTNGDVNLYRVNSDVMSLLGQYCCAIRDATNIDHTLCVNICE